MGNANGKEEGENGSEDHSGQSDAESGYNIDLPVNSYHPARANSVDSMGNSPPLSPGRSQSPPMFAPQLSTSGGRLIISSDGVWDALSSEMALNCCHGMSADVAAEQIVKEAVQEKGLRDDTTCIVVDILPPEKTTPTVPHKKPVKGVFKGMFRRRTSESSSYMDKGYVEPDVVEEIYEEGSAVLAERLETEYPLCTKFQLFMCAVCQIEMKPGEGISVHAGTPNPRKVRPWDGPFLCLSCQAKKEAMEGKRPPGDGARISSGSD